MIIDIIIMPITVQEDDRGWLKEVYRHDSNNFHAAMGYVSYTKHQTVRGPHEHKEQTDFFVFIGPGDFDLYLWDNRKKSLTYKKQMVLRVGESNPVSVKIPPGVIHGYKSVSSLGSISINLPDQLYKGENRKHKIDEIRHENDPSSPYKIP